MLVNMASVTMPFRVPMFRLFCSARSTGVSPVLTARSPCPNMRLGIGNDPSSAILRNRRVSHESGNQACSNRLVEESCMEERHSCLAELGTAQLAGLIEAVGGSPGAAAYAGQIFVELLGPAA